MEEIRLSDFCLVVVGLENRVSSLGKTASVDQFAVSRVAQDKDKDTACRSGHGHGHGPLHARALTGRRARLLELFDYYDVRQNSVLEDDELRCCLLEAGLELPGEELEKVMRAAGAAAHTSATREQFLAIVAQLERGGGGGGDGRRCSTPQQRRAFEEWVSADGDAGAAFPSRMTEAATPRTRARYGAEIFSDFAEVKARLEAEAKVRITEAEAKVRIAEAEAKVRIAEAEAKVRIAEADAKVQVLEAEARVRAEMKQARLQELKIKELEHRAHDASAGSAMDAQAASSR